MATLGEGSAQTSSALAIDVVTCTYNRAAYLDAVLAALTRQMHDDDTDWHVLVVDNASTDATPDVVASYTGCLPGLRGVFEARQGLTAARHRGVRETTAPWVAFVDDDNLLAPDWLSAIARAIRAHPEAGGIGGRVVLDWEVPPPPYLREFGFCFGEQDGAEADRVVDSLAGAGMVLRRAALVESGWFARPLLADRVGKRLVSGGDVEMAQRVRAAGYDLWLAPDAILQHRIPANRMGRLYLFRIIRGLGTSSAQVSALTWSGDWQSWQQMAHERRAYWYRYAKSRLKEAAKRRSGVTPALAWTFFAIGFGRGVRGCESLTESQRAAFFGAAPLPMP